MSEKYVIIKSKEELKRECIGFPESWSEEIAGRVCLKESARSTAKQSFLSLNNKNYLLSNDYIKKELVPGDFVTVIGRGRLKVNHFEEDSINVGFHELKVKPEDILSVLPEQTPLVDLESEKTTMNKKYVIIKSLEEIKQDGLSRYQGLGVLAGRVCLVTRKETDKTSEVCLGKYFRTIPDKSILRELNVGDFITTEKHGELSIRNLTDGIVAGHDLHNIKPEDILSVRTGRQALDVGTAVRLKHKTVLEASGLNKKQIEQAQGTYGSGLYFISNKGDFGGPVEIINEKYVFQVLLNHFDEVNLQPCKPGSEATLKSTEELKRLIKYLPAPSCDGAAVDKNLFYQTNKRINVQEEHDNFIEISVGPRLLTVHKAYFEGLCPELVGKEAQTALEIILDATKLHLTRVEKAVELEKRIKQIKEEAEAANKELKELNKLIKEQGPLLVPPSKH